MLPSTDSLNYTKTAKALHWIIAWLIIIMLAVGWTMTNMPNNSLKFSLFQWHKSIGITILLLSLFRLLWRLRHRTPPFPVDMPQWEKTAAKLTHYAFYILMIGMPLTGWVIVSSSPMNLPTMLYGLVQWPHLPVEMMGDKQAIGHTAKDMHYYGAFVFAVLAVLHIAAAWKHHLINRDDVLTRMAPNAFKNFLNRLRGMA